jgi:hypothetical protein
VLLANRVRELRRPRKTMSAQALVLRVTGLNAMVGFVYDFIGRPAVDADDREVAGVSPPADTRAQAAKNGDNAARDRLPRETLKDGYQ